MTVSSWSELGEAARGAVEPVANRWSGFAAKVRGRAREVTEEAEAGLDEVVAADPVHVNAIATAFSAVKSRFQGLQAKVSEAEEKLSIDWDEAVGQADLDDKDVERVGSLWTRIVDDSRALQRELERDGELICIKKNADWARQLQRLAQKEWQKPRLCGGCKAELVVTQRHGASSVTCRFCGAVNDVTLGAATGLFYQGSGVDSLAAEASREEWIAQLDAERRFSDLREPTPADRDRYLDAVRAYWTTYYRFVARLNPGFNRTVEQAVAARMLFAEQWANNAMR
ncbi:MAG: hypothetical protein HY901_32675 [Deltaproteobacteria bacterium]|nr:hypothetical protein [Deltaproteobacteria bacterium]